MMLGNAILSDNVLVKRMVVLGFDTLEIQCDYGNYGCKWQLKDYMLLPSGNVNNNSINDD